MEKKQFDHYKFKIDKVGRLLNGYITSLRKNL